MPDATLDESYFYGQNVANLQVLLEEVTRARPGSPETRFIRPEGEVLDRLSSKFHHVLYGRRGTGKSSLLRHIEASLRKSDHLVAWADQETFKALSYPDVLVGTLAEVFAQFASQLEEKFPETPRKWYQVRRPSIPPERRLAGELKRAVASLLDLQRAPSQSDIEWTESYSVESTATAERLIGAQIDRGGASVSGKYTKGRSAKNSKGGAVAHRYSASKSEHLERALTTYRKLIAAVGTIAPDSFIVLDDFYHLSEDDQPGVAGYFHRAVKDTGVWLKFGSISLWTRLYAGGTPPVGLQAPHDIRELSLDKGLEEFKRSKRFLETILRTLCEECDVDPRRLFSEGALDRLVLAAGGVPRDYIGLVSESIAVAKNRGPSAKPGSERVIAEDVNSAAGRSVDTKFNDMREDARGESEELRKLVIALTDHCRSTSSACFLINASDEALVSQVNRLQNMRFVHSIATNETLPNQKSERFHVYVLDVSQLAAQRAWQVDFMGWTKREGRRTRKLVYPSITQPQVATRSDLDQVAQDDERAVVHEVET